MRFAEQYPKVPIFGAAPGSGTEQKGESAEHAATMFRVGAATVKRAKRVQKEAPGRLADIRAGTVTVIAPSCFRVLPGGSAIVAEVKLVYIEVFEGKPVERALLIFKRKVVQAGILADLKRHRYAMSRGERRRRKRRQAARQRRRDEARRRR